MDNLTIIVPFFNGHEYVEGLLSGIPSPIPVIFVDDQSDWPLQVTRRPNIKVVRPDRKRYFTGAVNAGIQLCDTDVLVLNQDVRLVGTEWLNLIAENRETYALIGERIKGNHPAFPHGYVHGVFQFMRRDAIEQVGGMDEEMYPLWGASALWQWQICRQGFRSLPVEKIPGMTHLREGPFGSSIKRVLKEQPEHKDHLIRTPPEVSVIVPAYNYGRYLGDLVASFMGGMTSLGEMPGQTFQSFEMIIVNDGSTDETHEVCKQLCDPWQGIRYIRQENKGTAAAYNTGVRSAVGKYISCISADDMREPWGLENLYRGMIANPHSIVYDNLRVFRNGERGKDWMSSTPWPDYDFNSLLRKNMVPTNIMFPKSGWREVGGYPEILGKGREDWGFAIAMGRIGYCGVRLQEAGYLYRREGQNRTLRNTNREWMEYFRAQMRMLFPDLYEGRFPVGCCGKKQSASGKIFSNSVVKNGATAMASEFPSAENMVLLEYTGYNVGNTRWGGPKIPSKRTYVFGANERDRIKLVDKADLNWFLNRKGSGGEGLFRVHAPVPAAGVVSQEEPVVNAMFEPSESLEPVIDPANYTIAEIREMAFSLEGVNSVLALEKSGKNRSTLVSYLEEYLSDLENQGV